MTWGASWFAGPDRTKLARPAANRLEHRLADLVLFAEARHRGSLGVIGPVRDRPPYVRGHVFDVHTRSGDSGENEHVVMRQNRLQSPETSRR